jgi:hypothetical protein
LETAIFYGVVIGAIALSRVIFPHWWKEKPRGLLKAPEPVLPEDLPPGTRKARRTTIEKAKPGEYVAVLGKVVGAADLVSPMTHRPCVAMDLIVFDDDAGTLVTRVLRASRFVIEDHTGRASFDGRGAFVRVDHDQRLSGQARGAFEEGILPPAVKPQQRLTGNEGVIAPGEHVLVIGVCEKPGAGGDAHYRSSADSLVHISGGGVRPSMVSTKAKDLQAFEG